MYISSDVMMHFEIVTETSEPWDAFLLCSRKGCDWEECISERTLVYVVYTAMEHYHRAHKEQ